MRVVLIRGFESWQVFYSVRDDRVRVERVLHGARDLPKALGL